ncbi:CG32447 CG32447PBlike, partial [Caligus rogercresseyi]
MSKPSFILVLLALLSLSDDTTERRPYFRRKEFIRHRLNTSKESKDRRARLQTQFFNMKEDYGSSSSSSVPPRIKIPRPRRQNLCANSDLLECAPNSTRKSIGGIENVFSLMREEVWVIPLLIGDASLIIVLVVFEVFLLSKVIRSNPSRRHLFLSQVLMTGLFLCAGISVCHVLKPSKIACSVTRLGTGISYSIVFSTLLVKLVFLISLNSGVYLPGTYQCLLLVFAILIQVVIGVQWILSSPPQAKDGRCDLEFGPFLFSLLYVFFLMGVVSLLAFRVEVFGKTILMHLCHWIIGGFIAPLKYQPVGIGGGLLAVASITFVI